MCCGSFSARTSWFPTFCRIPWISSFPLLDTYCTHLGSARLTLGIRWLLFFCISISLVQPTPQCKRSVCLFVTEVQVFCKGSETPNEGNVRCSDFSLSSKQTNLSHTRLMFISDKQYLLRLCRWPSVWVSQREPGDRRSRIVQWKRQS